MVRLVVLGASCLVATEDRRPTHLVCLGEEHGLLIDCGVSPRGRLESLGLDPNRIGDIFITHFHPDHAAGLTLFLMEMCLRGRTRPVRVHSGAESTSRIRKVMHMYGWKKIPGQFPVGYRTVKRRRSTPVLANSEFRAIATPVRHVVPALGLRVELLQSRRSFVYSADTEPSAELAELASGADLLIHEATGEGPGHSSAAQAAMIAKQAGVGRLLLIHTNPYSDPDVLLAEARARFGGAIALAADKMEVDW
jgi:ribonuclease Z